MQGMNFTPLWTHVEKGLPHFYKPLDIQYLFFKPATYSTTGPTVFNRGRRHRDRTSSSSDTCKLHNLLYNSVQFSLSLLTVPHIVQCVLVPIVKKKRKFSKLGSIIFSMQSQTRKISNPRKYIQYLIFPHP